MGSYHRGMAGYLDVPGGSIWYDEQGQGQPLVLIHGGAVDARFFDPMMGSLAERFRVVTTDLWGHGRSADRAGDFSLASFASDVAQLIERVVGEPAHVLGHSIGAAVALELTLRRPDLVRKLVQVSGGFDAAADDRGDLDIEQAVTQTVAFLGASYGAVSPDGEEHFAVVVGKDFELSSREPAYTTEEVGTISQRTLIMTADDDLTPLEHSLDFYRALPHGELAVVPGTSHFLLQEKPELCAAIVLDFLAHDAVPTVAPMRRGAP
jgi:pimeloyl-ACP methyl ester carboxylesterase